MTSIIYNFRGSLGAGSRAGDKDWNRNPLSNNDGVDKVYGVPPCWQEAEFP